MRDLDDLVLEWEDRKAAGEPNCLEELCALYPEMAYPLREEVGMLEAVAKVLTVEDSETYPDSYRSKDPDIPERLPGYEIKRIIGRGGMGVVLEALDTSLKCPVALKTVHATWPPWYIVDQNVLNRRFAHEGQTLAKLNHPNIVNVRTTLTDNGRPYLVMELLRGSLAAQSETLTRRGTEAILAFMEKVARAVEHAHNKGVLHRDLKPSNILLDENGEPKVADFGLAKSFSHDPMLVGEIPFQADSNGAGSKDSAHWTTPGQEAGTGPWMAPERLDWSAGNEPTPASDIWALGVILYELLTGQRPFEGKTRQEIAEAISRGPPTPIRELAPHLSPKLEDLVQRCLMVDPKLRLHDAGVLANELARIRKPPFQITQVGLTLSLAAAIPLILVMSFSTPEQEKELGKFERNVAGLASRLKANETVDLIVPGKQPLYYLREGAGATEVNSTPEGVAIFAPALGLVELLPDIPVQHYRVEAQLEHLASHDFARGFVGLYCEAFHVTTHASRYHLLDMVRISEFTPAPTRTAVSSIHCVAFNKAFSARTFPYYAYSSRPDSSRSQAVYAPPPPGMPAGSRFLAFEVGPAGALGSWDSGKAGGPRKTFAPLDARLHSSFLDRLSTPGGNIYVPGIETSGIARKGAPRGLGIFVSCGHCLVRSVRVIPLPN